MGRWACLVLLAGAMLAPGLHAVAEEPAGGQFVANSACPALLSIRKGTNPGDARTEPGTSYKLLALNQKKPTHYRIEVPGAEPPERWVAVDCGTLGSGKPAPAAPKASAADRPAYVLAISWQPAFCEGSPNKRECRSQTASGFDATHFSLHGLWPQPSTREYCNVDPAAREASKSSHWRDLPDLKLSLSTRAELDTMMPGTQSYLDRHEWTKHGSCYPGRDPETYFHDALRLLKAINQSGVPGLLSSNVGHSVSTAEIRARFDQAFGQGAGERVRVACRDDGSRRLITELTIGLKGDIPGGTPVSDLIMASPPTDPGCPGGVVDPVGLQ